MGSQIGAGIAVGIDQKSDLQYWDLLFLEFLNFQ
jgi:hypothetical protein